MSTPRSVPYVLGFLAFAGICAAWASSGFKSPALAGPRPRLLYVSDPKISEVAVFSLPALVLEGTLIGFTTPHGLCSNDDNGNIWVTSTGTRMLLEYAHGGTSPIETLSDPTGLPFGCDVDRPHQKVWVTNIRDAASPSPPPPCNPTPSGPGELEVFNPNTGTWSCSYYAALLKSDISVALDPSGNAYVDGLTSSKHFALAKLPAGSTTIQQITISGGSVHYPGMVQWYGDGNYLAVGDRRCDAPRTTCIYHVKISGFTGTIIGKTKFKAYNGHVICDMAQGSIGAHGLKFLAGGDDESACGYAATSVDRWAFPAGGLPTNNNHSIAFSHPFGTAISR
jgi:hypothetical protein